MSPTSRETTHIARGTKVEGTISGQAELVIDGEVEGEIQLESKVVVGPEGRVVGTIVAGSIQVGGKVHGNLRGLERVEVLASGSLEGDVVSPRVIIAEGAFFKGKVEMVDKSAARGAAKESAPAKPAAPAPQKTDGAASSGSGKAGQ